MRITGKVQNTEDIDLTLSITMTIKEWKDLQKDLPERYPHWKLGGAITDAILKVNTTINEEITST
jgi:hypothetical protein